MAARKPISPLLPGGVIPATAIPQPAFLPRTRAELDALGWDAVDVLLVSGDAYVDHPSFGASLLGRLLAAHGWRVGMIAQPGWTSPDDVAVLGRPRLFAGVTAGSLDSMLAHYTAFRKKRSDDAYTPDGQAGARPNRAAIVYANLMRQAFPGLPVVLGGIEASLRRASHYDFWSDALRKPILLDAKANLVVYGMAERVVLEIARRIAEQGEEADLHGLPGTVWACDKDAPDLSEQGWELRELPSHEEIAAEPAKLVQATRELEKQVHQGSVVLRQRVGARAVCIAPPPEPLSQAELDALYGLPFSRTAHPGYEEPIPAETMIRQSVTSHRGCAGGCAFCALALHQGRRIRSRSRESILGEVATMTAQPGFDGQVSDVGGPSANMWNAACLADPAACTRASCLTPRICKHFSADQGGYVDLLRQVRELPRVKGVRVASGFRYDLGLQDPEALEACIAEFVGGQFKVAPEHLSPPVLKAMRKPPLEVFERFLDFFARASRTAGKEQYVVPYLMSAHPGCTPEAMRQLSDWLAARGWRPRQVQCFIPLPGTMAAAMFYTGTDEQGRPLPVARSDADRLAQHAMLVPQTGRPAKKSTRGQGQRPTKPAKPKTASRNRGRKTSR